MREGKLDIDKGIKMAEIYRSTIEGIARSKMVVFYCDSIEEAGWRAGWTTPGAWRMYFSASQPCRSHLSEAPE